LDLSIEEKIDKIAKDFYGADVLTSISYIGDERNREIQRKSS
jgi:formyltetrahydrofolate synthetase